jgi:hypothetical protein
VIGDGDEIGDTPMIMTFLISCAIFVKCEIVKSYRMDSEGIVKTIDCA